MPLPGPDPYALGPLRLRAEDEDRAAHALPVGQQAAVVTAAAPSQVAQLEAGDAEVVAGERVLRRDQRVERPAVAVQASALDADAVHPHGHVADQRVVGGLQVQARPGPRAEEAD